MSQNTQPPPSPPPGTAGTQICFGGWFLCRMATDPDPPDEKRGISGASFAAAGEPDLDGIIRFQAPQATLRSHGPQVGVRVTGVSVTGQPVPDHPLTGATVELLNGPKYYEENGIIAARNTAFIDPFEIKIAASNGAMVQRSALWDPSRPDLSYYEVSEATLKPRQIATLALGQADVLAKAITSSGSIAYQQDEFIRARLAALQQDLETEKDPVARAALEQRIHVLQRKDWQAQKIRILLAAKCGYNFPLNGQSQIQGVSGLDGTAPWNIAFWMGAWDNDALCGYVEGALDIGSSS